MANRFDYVKYDDKAATHHEELKSAFMLIEKLIERVEDTSIWKELSLVSLEETFMKVGKALKSNVLTRQAQAEMNMKMNMHASCSEGQTVEKEWRKS